jgi:hypothetical protein
MDSILDFEKGRSVAMALEASFPDLKPSYVLKHDVPMLSFDIPLRSGAARLTLFEDEFDLGLVLVRGDRAFARQMKMQKSALLDIISSLFPIGNAGAVREWRIPPDPTTEWLRTLLADVQKAVLALNT